MSKLMVALIAKLDPSYGRTFNQADQLLKNMTLSMNQFNASGASMMQGFSGIGSGLKNALSIGGTELIRLKNIGMDTANSLAGITRPASDIKSAFTGMGNIVTQNQQAFMGMSNQVRTLSAVGMMMGYSFGNAGSMITKLGTSAQTTFGYLKRDIDPTMRQMNQLNQTVTTGTQFWSSYGFTAAYAVNSVAGQLRQLTTSILESSANMEMQHMRLVTIFKDVGHATEMLNWSIEMAKKTPFDVKGIVEASVKLNVFGQDAKKWLPLTGDLAAGMGKDIEYTGLVMSKALSGSRTALRSLRDQFGITQPELARFGAEVDKQGRVLMTTEEELEKFSNAMERMIRANFGGGMERQMGTLIGRIQNLQDAIERVSFKFGDTLLPQAKFVVTGLEKVITVAENLPTPLKFLISIAGITATALTTVAGSALFMGAILFRAGEAFGQMILWMTGAANGTIPLVAAVNSLNAASLRLQTGLHGQAAAAQLASGSLGNLSKHAFLARLGITQLTTGLIFAAATYTAAAAAIFFLGSTAVNLEREKMRITEESVKQDIRYMNARSINHQSIMMMSTEEARAAGVTQAQIAEAIAGTLTSLEMRKKKIREESDERRKSFAQFYEDRNTLYEIDKRIAAGATDFTVQELDYIKSKQKELTLIAGIRQDENKEIQSAISSAQVEIRDLKQKGIELADHIKKRIELNTLTEQNLSYSEHMYEIGKGSEAQFRADIESRLNYLRIYRSAGAKGAYNSEIASINAVAEEKKKAGASSAEIDDYVTNSKKQALITWQNADKEATREIYANEVKLNNLDKKHESDAEKAAAKEQKRISETLKAEEETYSTRYRMKQRDLENGKNVSEEMKKISEDMYKKDVESYKKAAEEKFKDIPDYGLKQEWLAAQEEKAVADRDDREQKTTEIIQNNEEKREKIKARADEKDKKRIDKMTKEQLKEFEKNLEREEDLAQERTKIIDTEQDLLEQASDKGINVYEKLKEKAKERYESELVEIEKLAAVKKADGWNDIQIAELVADKRIQEENKYYKTLESLNKNEKDRLKTLNDLKIQAHQADTKIEQGKRGYRESDYKKEVDLIKARYDLEKKEAEDEYKIRLDKSKNEKEEQEWLKATVDIIYGKYVDGINEVNAAIDEQKKKEKELQDQRSKPLGGTMTIDEFFQSQKEFFYGKEGEEKKPAIEPLFKPEIKEAIKNMTGEKPGGELIKSAAQKAAEAEKGALTQIQNTVYIDNQKAVGNKKIQDHIDGILAEAGLYDMTGGEYSQAVG